MHKTKYIPSESATSFCFSELCLRIKKEMKEKLSTLTPEQMIDLWPTILPSQIKNRDLEANEELIHAMIQRSLKKFNLNGQTFEYSCRKNHLGGYRWYVLCPQCKKVCLKLYLPNKYKDKEQIYQCKKCHGLKNSSSLLGATKRYKKVIKPLKRLEAIKAILLKRGVRSEKAKNLLLEYEQIERELDSSPEYRLWKFQREHAASNKIS
jgi:hypothetical protein